MKKLISIALSLCMVLSLLPATALASGFSDMPDSSHWSYTALQSAVDNKLLNGSDGKLLPKDALTRAQMAAIINRAFGAIDTADVSRFSDVSTSDWFYADIAKAVRMGTFQGDETNLMNPNTPITREQAFTVLARAFHLEDGKTSVLAGFADGAQVSSYARGPLSALVAEGYVGGSDGKLLPKDSISREQFAQVVYNMIQHYITAAGTYTEDLDGNVIVNVPGVVIQGATINGDLIIGEGVGNGELTLDSVELTGRLIVRGGGENSIIIKNNSRVGNVIVSKTGDGGVRLFTEDGCRVEVVSIPDGKDNIVLEGMFNQVSVATDAPVVLKSATVTALTVTGENAAISTQGKTSVTSVVVEEKAVGATLTVGGSSTIAKVESAAENVTIDGKGTVTQVTVSGDNTAVNTQGTSITTTDDVSGVTAGGQTVAPGTTDGKPATPSTPSTPSVPDDDDDYYEDDEDDSTPTVNPKNIKTLSELVSALSDGAEYIKVTNLIVVERGALTISKGQTLEIANGAGLLLTGKNVSLTNNGTIVNNALSYKYVSVGAGKGAYELVDGKYVFVGENQGTYHTEANLVAVGSSYARTGFDIQNGAKFVNNGTFQNEGSFLATGTVENNGSMEVALDMSMNIWGEFVNEGTIENNCGTFNVGAYNPNNQMYENKQLYGYPTKAQEPDVTLNGTFTNNGGFIALRAGTVTLGEDGVIYNYPDTVHTNEDEQNYFMLRDGVLTIDGVFNNYGMFNMFGDGYTPELVINGTYNNGSDKEYGESHFDHGTTTVNGILNVNDASHIAMLNGTFTNNGNVTANNIHVIGTEVVNNGAWMVDGWMGIDPSHDIWYVDESQWQYASFTNNGSFLVEGGAHVDVQETAFSNYSHLVNNGSMNLYKSDLYQQGKGSNRTAVFENSGNMNVTGGSFKIHNAKQETFVNTGYLSINDEYWGEGEDLICEIEFSDNDFDNSSFWLDYIANIYDPYGLPRVEAIQLEKLATREDSDAFFPEDGGAYNQMHAWCDLVIDEDLTLKAFPQYWVSGPVRWNDETEQDEFTFVTMTVEEGVTLTLGEDSGLFIAEAGLHNEGVIVGGENNVVSIRETGSYSGDGEITCHFEVVFRENVKLELQDIILDGISGYIGYTLAEEKNGNVYVVDNDTDIEAAITIDHLGTLDGAAMENAFYVARVTSSQGLRGAALATWDNDKDSGNFIFGHTEIEHDYLVELHRDTTLRGVYVCETADLEIPYGTTLTVAEHGYLDNAGGVHVYGTLDLQPNASLHNHQLLEVGVLSGDELAQLIVGGYLYNNNFMQLYPAGQLLNGGGEFWNHGELNESEGSVNEFDN
ncbi:MAG: S-layer homology domain-containing protein [Oscillospiraceae bacterium]|nr:S-layer homology domain-containing protein [Oscillospiraceae bacterium]